MKQIVGIALTLLCGVALLILPTDIGASADGKTTNPPPSTICGAIEGVVTFRGEIPKSSVADDAGTRRDLLEVDRASGGLQSVVVWLVMDRTSAREHDLRATQPSKVETPVALVDQRDHEFVPRVLAIRSGQPVKFTNSDSANHNVRTSSSQPTNEFNVFTGVDGSYTHRFATDPQQRPVRLGCDIHPWMRGWVYVFEHPHFSVTDAKGRFRIADAPPGRYKLALRQPDIRYGEEREVTVSAGKLTRLDMDVKIQDKSASEE